MTEPATKHQYASPRPWSYHRAPVAHGFFRDWIDDANGGEVVANVGHVDGPLICQSVNTIDELREAAADYARLIQVENFDRNDIAVHRAYSRLRLALSQTAT